ncbi:MAG: hypothetical protein WCQ49_02315 [Candidatus Saccharibacteria bacterium]
MHMQDDNKTDTEEDKNRHEEIELFDIKSKLATQNIRPEANNKYVEQNESNKWKRRTLMALGALALSAIVFVTIRTGSNNSLIEQQRIATENNEPGVLDIILDNNNIVFSNETKEFVFSSGDGLNDAAMTVEGREKVDLRFIVDRIKSLNVNLPQVIPIGYEIVVPISVDTTTSNIDAYSPIGK